MHMITKKEIIKALNHKDVKFEKISGEMITSIVASLPNGTQIEFVDSDITNSYVLSVNRYGIGRICIGHTVRPSCTRPVTHQNSDVLDIADLMLRKSQKQPNHTEKFVIDIVKQKSK